MVFHNENSEPIHAPRKKTQGGVPAVLRQCTVKRSTTSLGIRRVHDWNERTRIILRVFAIYQNYVGLGNIKY